MHTRGLQYFTLSEIAPRVWFMLRGCNFRCRGCFRPARDEGGTQLTAEEALARMERACLDYYGTLPREAMITGGEPTLDKAYLVQLVRGLKTRGFARIVLMTNGYALGEDERYVPELTEAGLTEAHVDVKAFSEELHQWYTGKSSKPVLQAIQRLNASGITLIVQTVLIPGIVDLDEIEQIARFLATVNKHIPYRINPFAPTFAFDRVSRRPTLEEMERAYDVASRYLPNAIVSRSCYREYPTPPPQKTWITVYPDLTVKRRSMEDQKEDRLAWLSADKSREQLLEDWQKIAWDAELRRSLVGISEHASSRARPFKETSPQSGVVTVKFTSALHAITKAKSTELTCNGSLSVETVINRLAGAYGEQFNEAVLTGRGTDGPLTLKRSFSLYLNGLEIGQLQGLQTEVRGGDELIILSWVSGG
ncbi:MAG TPA: radical SAM protein [Methanomicrobia archaeon]|nr:radical SAM protein [Methanomicrobia archaeon]